MIKDFLDIRTLSFITLLFCSTFGFGLLIYSKTQKKFRGISWFGIGVIVSSLGFLLISLRAYIPDLFSIIVANGMIIGGLTLIYGGLRRFGTRRPVSIWFLGALFSVFLVSFILFTYTDPNIEMRIVVVSGLTTILSALCGWVLIDVRGDGVAKQRYITATPFFGYAVYGLFRIVWTIGGSGMTDFLEADVVQAFAFVAWCFQILLSSFGLLWMTSSILEIELREQARIDPLTQLLNRRALEEIAYREVNRAKRGSYELSVAMVDIDRFKQLNDTMGHQAGDTVLASIAGLLTVGLRTQDVVARYGGEEFIVVLPDTGYSLAFALTQRIRREIETYTVTTETGAVSITASAGVASFGGEQDEWEDIVGRADDALYRAKEGGRNLVR